MKAKKGLEECHSGASLKKLRINGRTQVDSVRRRADGYWRVHIHVDYNIALPDGRKLVVNGEVLLSAKQFGRKPNPGAFKKKGKRLATPRTT